MECPFCERDMNRNQLGLHIATKHKKEFDKIINRDSSEESENGELDRRDLQGLEIFERERLAERNETVAPKNAILEITKNCPLNCIHCFATARGGFEELPGEKWYKIMDKLYDKGVENLVLEGGEPTIHKDFYNILEYATQLFDVTIQTAGVTDTNLNDFDCNVTVSFEYLNPVHNNEIRRKYDPEIWEYDKRKGVLYKKEDKDKIDELAGKFEGGEDVREEVSKIAKPLKEENTWQKALTKLKAVDQPKTLRGTVYNDNDILGLAMLAESVNANSVFVPLKPIGLGKKLKSKLPSSKRLLDVIKNIMTYNQYSKMEHRVEETYWYLMNRELWKKYEDVFKYRGRVCESGINRLFITHRGDVKPCFMLPNEQMGNIIEDDIDDIYSNLYDYHLEAKEIAKNKRCSSCFGGCMAVAKYREGMSENPCPMKLKKKDLNKIKAKT